MLKQSSDSSAHPSADLLSDLQIATPPSAHPFPDPRVDGPAYVTAIGDQLGLVAQLVRARA
jgi:hypothetical protein